MESDLCSSFLFDRIFFDEPASTSSENAVERPLPRQGGGLFVSGHIVPYRACSRRVAESIRGLFDWLELKARLLTQGSTAPITICFALDRLANNPAWTVGAGNLSWLTGKSIVERIITMRRRYEFLNSDRWLWSTALFGRA